MHESNGLQAYTYKQHLTRGKHAGPSERERAAQLQVIQVALKQGLSKLRKRILVALNLADLHGKAFTIIRAKSLNELDCGMGSIAAELFL